MARKLFVSAMTAASLAASMAMTVSPAFAVDCQVVNKDLRGGRWPEDIALSRNVTLAQIKSCQSAPKNSPPAHSNANPAPGKPRSTEKSAPSKR